MFQTFNFSEFVEKNYVDLIKLITPRTSTMSTTDRMELLHDFLINFRRLRGLERFDATKGVPYNTYIVRSLYNFCSSSAKVRKNRQRLANMCEYSAVLEETLAASTNPGPAQSDLSALSASIRHDDAIPSNIKARLIKVLKSRVSGFTQAEIARDLGCSIQVINSDLQRIRKKWKKITRP